MLLEIARFSDGERDEAFVGYLRGLFATHPPDLIVTMVSPAARFIQRHRQDLFPSTPVIFAALDARAIRDATLTANDTMVAVSTDQRAIIENILRTLPGTTNVAVVTGDAPIERFWVKELRQVGPSRSRTGSILSFSTNCRSADMLKRVAALPPRSAIYYGDLVVDAQGDPAQTGGGSGPAARRSQRADIRTVRLSAGRRHCGGASPLCPHTEPEDRRGRRADPCGERRPAISRPRHRNLGSLSLTGGSCGDGEYDEADLPPGSTISFREPTLWEQYRWYILAAAGFSGLQAILIVGLLLNRLRLRRAHDRLRTSEEGMSLAAIAAKLRFWVWDIPRDEVRASESDWSSGNWHSAHPVHFDQFIDIVHPDDRESLRQAVRGALEGDGQYETEYRVMSPDSTVRWIAARGRIEFDQNGKPRQLRAISIDITERRRGEDEARDLNGRLITAHEDERARLAHALHDDVTQRLALLAIDAGQKEKGLGDTIAGQAMRSIRRDLVQLSEDVHALSYALHPAILEDLGLIEALKAECARFGAVEGIPTSFRAADGVDEPTQALSLCLYRVTQEALRNVARHSGASLVEVELRAVGGGLELAVQDNGVGFDPTRKQARPSLGLAGMRQRLSLVDGELLIDSAPGGGTSIVARAP